MITPFSRRWGFLLSLLLPIAAAAIDCDGLFHDGMETPRYPAVAASAGCGGHHPGSSSRSVFVAGLGTQTYHIHVPAGYSELRAVPWLLVWHGAGGPGTAPAAARATRDAWAPVADEEGFIVVAQVATGSQGGWIPSNAVAVRDAILADVAAAYNVDQARLLAWGFSAGGHVLHGVALDQPQLYAAYGVSAGALAAYAGPSAPARAPRRIPLMISVGIYDSLYPYALGDHQIFDESGWRPGSDLHFLEWPIGHSFSEPHLRAFWNLLGDSVRP